MSDRWKKYILFIHLCIFAVSLTVQFFKLHGKSKSKTFVFTGIILEQLEQLSQFTKCEMDNTLKIYETNEKQFQHWKMDSVWKEKE